MGKRFNQDFDFFPQAIIYIYIYTCEDRASVSTRTNCLFEYEYERLHHLGSVDDPPILKHAFPEQSFPGERGF